MEEEPLISGEEIKQMVLAKLDEYEGLNPLEQYAMFMGKAQILELGLKGLLARKFDVSIEKSEKWTLGQVKKELEKKELRPDFLAFLKEVVEYQNYLAHEFLAFDAITSKLVEFSCRKKNGFLFRAVYALEQIIILYDLCEKHDAWQ